MRKQHDPTCEIVSLVVKALAIAKKHRGSSWEECEEALDAWRETAGLDGDG